MKFVQNTQAAVQQCDLEKLLLMLMHNLFALAKFLITACICARMNHKHWYNPVVTVEIFLSIDICSALAKYR